MKLPQYDEMHIVSDLHMGGKAGFQILRETQRLAAFVNWVAAQRPEGRVALVLNGDIIDTLAEDISGYIAVDEAQAVVQRIMADPAFAPVWEALADFVRTARRVLVMIIGNHDIELSFPVVQQTIVARLAGDDLESRARIEFSTMGAGYAAVVGDSRVFCTHGNEVDAWNYVRYEDLAKAARRINSGRRLEPGEWEPNAGTKMVKTVMNAIKEKRPWIDLLKPEINAAVGVLLAIDPGQLKKIKQLIPVIGEKIVGDRQVDQRLSAEGYSPPPADQHTGPEALDGLLGPNLMEGLRQGAGADTKPADVMLRAAEKDYQNGSAATDPDDETLSAKGTLVYWWDRLTSMFTGITEDEALRRALLDWLKDDPTYEIDTRDETFKEVHKTVGPEVHFIVTGHTHLERAIKLGGGRFYFNCGTWIRLLQITDAMLKDKQSFEPVFKLLYPEEIPMKAIDDAEFKDANSNDVPFVLDRSSAVCIRSTDSGVIGELAHVQKDGKPKPIETFKR